MGKKNNINPGHHKTAGRERQGDDIVQEIHKQEYAQAEAAQKKADTTNFIPGAAPVVLATLNARIRQIPEISQQA